MWAVVGIGPSILLGFKRTRSGVICCSNQAGTAASKGDISRNMPSGNEIPGDASDACGSSNVSSGCCNHKAEDVCTYI